MKKFLALRMAIALSVALTACGTSETSKPEQNKDTRESVAVTESSVETPSEETVEANETDMDIILRDDHPTYYGSVEKSHEIWDDVEKNRIHFGDKSYGYNDNPILSMDAYRNSDLIRQVLINFLNFSDTPTVTIDEAIRIAASYMPYEVMDKYYEFNGSELIVPDESREDDPSYYVISYRLTDEGSEAYYSKEHDYSGTIDVIIQVSNEAVDNLDITFGTPRWMSSLEKNSYHKEEWSCDLYDYR